MPPTSWIRLTPLSRDLEMQSALQAQVHDPLWMLARQWQLGEFRAEDGGSPILAEIWAFTAPIVSWTPAPGSGVQSTVAFAYDARTAPLEAVVERERIVFDDAATRSRAVEAGLHFLRLLEAKKMAKYQSGFTKEYALRPLENSDAAYADAAATRFLDVMVHRVPDGGLLYAALRAALPRGGTTRALPDKPTIARADQKALLGAVDEWLAWYEGALFDEPRRIATPSTTEAPPALPDAPAWRRDRMEYEMDVETGALGPGQSGVVLNTPEYTGGELDWFAFDIKAAPSPPPMATPRLPTYKIAPAPVTYGGMPSPRYWQFEDARVNFSAMKFGNNGGGKDVGALLLLEFALVYGNDWFVAPIDLPVGSVTRVDALVVTDTFGERTAIQPIRDSGRGSDADWAMFTLAPSARSSTATGSGTDAPALLFVPPALVRALESAPIEEVLLARDEMANLAWAIERVVEGAAGRPISRYEEAMAKRARLAPTSVAPANASRLAYQIRTDVPEHWLPLVPVRERDAAMSLHLGALDAARLQKPLGRVLGGPPLVVREEEVPRGGVRVTRAYRYARAIDGSAHLWIGRRKQPGRGEASSGLQFDTVTRTPST